METRTGTWNPNTAHSLDVDAVVEALHAPQTGLTSAQVYQRREELGSNSLPHGESKPAWRRFLGHLEDVLIYILLTAAVLKALTGDRVNFAVIAAAALAVATVGFIQEGRAEQALESIRSMLSLEAQARRDGEWAVVDAESLVPGDLVERGQTAPHHRTAIDLVGRIHELDSLDKADQLAHYLHPQGDNRFEILASQEEAATKQIIDAEAFRSMHAVLKTFYSPILVDTGNASTATTWQAALEAADVVVVVIENASNAVRKAATTLDTIREAAGDEKVSNAVIMLTGTRDPSKARRDRIHEVLAPRVRSIVDVPWDPSLKEGNEIIWELLQPKTREAYLRASAAIIEGM